MKNPLPPALMRMAKIAVLAGLAVLLWHAADGRTALARLQGADLWWLALAGLALVIQTVLSAQRWRVTAAQLGLTIPPVAALREYYLAQVVNQSLPGGVVGDANRAVRSRSEAGLMASAQAVLFERLAGQVGLICVLIFGLGVSVAIPSAIDWPLWLLTPLLVAIGAVVVLAVLFKTLPALHKFGHAFLGAVWARDIRAQQAALSLGTAICNVAAFALCAVALDVAMPLIAVAALVPLILFAMVLPVSIGGWGVREGAAALLFPVMGATAAEGLATSVAFGLVFLVTILPGLILPLFHSDTPRAPRGPLLQHPIAQEKET